VEVKFNTSPLLSKFRLPGKAADNPEETDRMIFIITHSPIKEPPPPAQAQNIQGAVDLLFFRLRQAFLNNF